MDNEYIKNLEDALYEAIDIALINCLPQKVGSTIQQDILDSQFFKKET